MLKEKGRKISEKEEKPKKAHAKALDRAVTSEQITHTDARLIENFISEISGQRDITDKRKSIIVETQITFREFMPEFTKCKTEDIFTAIGRYRDSTHHANSTQRQRIVTFKMFVTWLIDSDHNPSLNAAKISKIKINFSLVMKSESDILTGDELKAIYQAARNLRDRAFLEVLYDTGGRINEICTLKWSQIEFSGNKTMVTVKSKTEKQRKIPLFTSSTTLKNWMKQCPGGIDPKAYVFFGRLSDRFKAISYNTAYRIVKAAAKDAGLAKNVHPHIFRHTRITDLLRLGFPEQDIKMVMWGSVTSEMLKVYAHLTPTDAVNSLYRGFGIDTDDEYSRVHAVVTPKTCPKCFEINSADDMFCSMCGNSLTCLPKVRKTMGFSHN